MSSHSNRYPHRPGWKRADTSSAAADRITPYAMSLRDRVYALLKENYPNDFTADELAEPIGASILSTRPRVAELHRSGLIEPTAERRMNKSGMRAICWRAKVRNITEAA